MERELIEKKIREAIFHSQSVQEMGEVATYIPELAFVDPDNFAFSLITAKGEIFTFGDQNIRFSMQSISKVISLIMAIKDVGRKAVYQKVGTEPTKYQFNSLIPIEERASNPLINAGAITTASLILGNTFEEKFQRVLYLVQTLAQSNQVCLLENVYHSEMETTDRNRAISYYLRSKQIFSHSAEDVLDLYVKNCSIGTTVEEMARIAAVLSNAGCDLKTGEELIPREIVEIVLAQMASCGMYEESGKFLLEVGFPAKSGVSGAIMAIVPGKCGICTYAPRLDESGNSIRGKFILEEISNSLQLNLFVPQSSPTDLFKI